MKKVNARKLTKMQQQFVIDELASGWRPSEVVEHVKEEFGIIVSRQNIHSSYVVARADEIELRTVQINRELHKKFPIAMKSRRIAQLQMAADRLEAGWLKTLEDYVERFSELKGSAKAEALFEAMTKLPDMFKEALDYELRILRQAKDEVEGNTVRVKQDTGMSKGEEKEFEETLRKRCKRMSQKEFDLMFAKIVNKVGVDHADTAAD